MRKTDNKIQPNRNTKTPKKVLKVLFCFPKDINTLFSIDMKKIFIVLFVALFSACSSYKAIVTDKMIVPNVRYGNFIVVVSDSTNGKIGVYVRPDYYFKKEVGDSVNVHFDPILQMYNLK